MTQGVLMLILAQLMEMNHHPKLAVFTAAVGAFTALIALVKTVSR